MVVCFRPCHLGILALARHCRVPMSMPCRPGVPIVGPAGCQLQDTPRLDPARCSPRRRKHPQMSYQAPVLLFAFLSLCVSIYRGMNVRNYGVFFLFGTRDEREVEVFNLGVMIFEVIVSLVGFISVCTLSKKFSLLFLVGNVIEVLFYIVTRSMLSFMAQNFCKTAAANMLHDSFEACLMATTHDFVKNAWLIPVGVFWGLIVIYNARGFYLQVSDKDKKEQAGRQLIHQQDEETPTSNSTSVVDDTSNTRMEVGPGFMKPEPCEMRTHQSKSTEV